MNSFDFTLSRTVAKGTWNGAMFPLPIKQLIAFVGGLIAARFSYFCSKRHEFQAHKII